MINGRTPYGMGAVYVDEESRLTPDGLTYRECVTLENIQTIKSLIDDPMIRKHLRSCDKSTISFALEALRKVEDAILSDGRQRLDSSQK